MTHVLVKHRVNDYETWKKVFDDFAETRKSGGEQSYQIMHPENEPNNLTLIFEWDNKQNAEKFMSSDALKTTMQKAGVAETPNITFLNHLDRGTP